MTVKYGFYNSLNSDRLYDANDVGTMLEGIFSDGVFEHVGDCFEPTSYPGRMNVIIGSGRASFKNLWIRNTSAFSVGIPASHVIYDRIDLIVLEFNSDIAVRENAIRLLVGTPSPTPIRPPVINTSSLNQYIIAEVLVRAGTTSILQTDITNLIGTVNTPYATCLISEMPVVREILTGDRVYYVRTDGNDSNDGLTDSAGGAFLTATKARDAVRAIDGGGFKVTVKFGTGTWNELVDWTGFTGVSTFNLLGTYVDVETVSAATVTVGTATTRGTITKTGAFTGDTYDGFLAYYTTDLVYRVIRSNTNDDITIIGQSPSATTQDIIVRKPGTEMAGMTANGLASAMNVEAIHFTASSPATYPISSARTLGTLIIYQCWFNKRPLFSGPVSVTINRSYFYNTDIQFDFRDEAVATIVGCYIHLYNDAGYVNVFHNAQVVVNGGTTINGLIGANKANYGWIISTGGSARFLGTGGNPWVENCDNGINYAEGTSIAGSSLIVYSNCTTNVVPGNPIVVKNTAVSTQTGFSSDTYLVGAAITIGAGAWIAKTTYRCRFDMTKTAAGTGAFTITVRMGTVGSTADASIMTFVFGAGTPVADTGLFEVFLTFRTVGSGTSAVIQGIAACHHNLNSTGLISTGGAGMGIIQTTSAGFNSTTQTKIGLSINGGASFSGTVNFVEAELLDYAL